MSAVQIIKTKGSATAAPFQASLTFEAVEADRKIPKQQRAECVRLLRELIEAVVSGSRPRGGQND
jgi:hypothetical protein